MKKFWLVLIVLLSINILNAQSEPVMYFCENYGDAGEVGVSDRFTTGSVVIMVKADFSLELEKCTIQYDKLNTETKEFEFYKDFQFKIKPEMSFVFFKKNSQSDLTFEETGIYRVFLLNSENETIASSLVEIISGD